MLLTHRVLYRSSLIFRNLSYLPFDFIVFTLFIWSLSGANPAVFWAQRKWSAPPLHTSVHCKIYQTNCGTWSNLTLAERVHGKTSAVYHAHFRLEFSCISVSAWSLSPLTSLLFSGTDFGSGSRRMAPYYHMLSQIRFRWSTTNLLKLSSLIISMMWFSTLAKMVCSLHYDLLLKEVLVYIPYQVFLLDVWCLFCCHFNFKN